MIHSNKVLVASQQIFHYSDFPPHIVSESNNIESAILLTVLKFDYIIIIIDNWYLLHIEHLQNSYREFFCSSKCRQKIVQFSNTCTRCELSIFRTVAHLHEALCNSIRFPPVEVLQNIFSYEHTHALSAIFHPFWKLPSWSFHESCKW